MILFKIALRNSFKNWKHSVSALLSLSASFVSLVLFDGYIKDIQILYHDNFKYRQMLGDVIIENNDLYSKKGISEPWNFLITKNEQVSIDPFLETISEIKYINKNLQFNGMITNGRQSQILIGRGYNLKIGALQRVPNWSWNTAYGIPLEQADNDFAAVMGKGLAKKMNCNWDVKAFNHMPKGNYVAENRPFECETLDLQISSTTTDGQLNAIDTMTVGLIDAGYKDIDDRYIQTSIQAAQTLLNTDKITFYSVTLKSEETITQSVSKINSFLNKTHPGLKASAWQNHRMGEMYAKTMDFLSLFRNFVIITIIIVSTLSVINTMIKLVKERTKEIGAMRSLGFRKNQITFMFTLESLYLSLMGTFIGVMSSVILTTFLNALEIKYKAGLLSEAVPFRIAIDGTAYLTATILLISVGTLASVLATKQTISHKIVDNINYV